MNAAPISKDKTRVYLDQNVFSHIAREETDWCDDPYVRVLLRHSAHAEVWVSPTHVMELMLCRDTALRQRLAGVMLSLCEGRRMMRDYGSVVVAGFLTLVEHWCAGSISSRSYAKYYDETLKQLFLGGLALMATGHIPNSSVIEQLTRMKVENRWLRAEAGKEPHSWVAAVKDCATGLRLTANPARPELAEKTLDTLVTEIRDFERQAQRIDKKDRATVERERGLLVRAYAVGDVFEAISTTFGQLAGDLLLTFNFDHLAAEWASVSEKLRCSPLPKGPAPDHHAFWMLEELIRCLWHKENGGVSAARLSQEVVFRDYLDRLNETGKDREERLSRESGSLPTDSLTFDADHAALALGSINVFVTRDQVLLNSCKTVAKSWADELHWECRSVFSPEQLDKALGGESLPA